MCYSCVTHVTCGGLGRDVCTIRSAHVCGPPESERGVGQLPGGGVLGGRLCAQAVQLHGALDQ
eukprot:6798946-Pyramimonas_sp.AAC.1